MQRASYLLGVTTFSLLLSTPLAWQWDSPPSSTLPSPRAGHSLTRLVSTSALALCGGQGADGVDIAGCWTLSPPEGWRFEAVLDAGEALPRSDHSAAAVPSLSGQEFLVLYGGVSLSANASSAERAGCELFASAGIWKPAAPSFDCDVANAPAARFAHSAALFSSGLWLIVGGIASEGSPRVLDDGVQVLDLSLAPMVRWAVPLLRNASSGESWPPPRAYHAAEAFGESLVVVGGQSDVSGQALLDDVWLLGPVDSAEGLLSARWSKLSPLASAGPMRGHKLAIVGSLLLVYGGGESVPSGGIRILDLSAPPPSSSWTIPSAGNSPCASFRSGTALLDADGESDPELVVFGGTSVEGGVISLTNNLCVLSRIGDAEASALTSLPVIIGGSAAGFGLLAVLAFVAYRRGRVRVDEAGLLIERGSADPDEAGVSTSPSYGSSEPTDFAPGRRYGFSPRAPAAYTAQTDDLDEEATTLRF